MSIAISNEAEIIVKNWTLRAARSYVISELQAAEHSELQALRHLRNAGEEWINIKEELGERGLNISDWCKAHMPVSRQWLDRHAELAKGWRKFLSARKWANDVGYTSRRESGLDYALELMAAKQRSDTISSASRLAQDPVTERLSPGVTALSRVRILTGDALKMLRTLSSASVDVCVTSPPYYYSLRDYQCEGQIGNEPTVEAYVNNLVAVFQEVRRVLREQGSMWINIGDIFASAATAWSGQGGIHRRQNKPLMVGARAKTPDGVKPKDLMLLGAQAAIALQKDGWFLRNEIIWHKKGVRPESVSDRFTRTHEKVYLFTKAGSYWFDQDEVREPLVTKPRAMTGSKGPALPRRVLRVGDRVRVWTAHPLGRNGRDIWEIATTSHKGKHPATFPTELVRRCLKASCPPAGHVLDPFGGSGTTGLAAVELGHTATLIELNPEYVTEARCRLRAGAVSVAAITRSEPVVLNKSTTLYHGDCCELMQAIPDGTIGLVVIDPPFYLNVPTDRTVIDYYIKQNGMKARFRERWDQFDDPNEYYSSLKTCSTRPSACYLLADRFLYLQSTRISASSIS
jgi:DNA modification methylase